ncbi:MAG: hypothetical protein PVG27_04725 [Chloroflexota bacterium]|jgi:plastocyanin
MSRSRTLALVGTAALLLVSAAPAVAQDDAAMDVDGLTIDVGGVEYAFTGLPTSVPAGTTLTFTNNGAEIHELVLNRLADDVTESFEELMALNESGVDLEAEGYIDTDFGFPMFLAAPGQTADGSITLDREGRYVALCYIPSGMEMAKLIELGVDPSSLGPETDPSTLSPEVQAFLDEVMGNPPHLAQGMIQEFVVTAGGTEVGPLPAEEESAPEDESATSEGRIVELELNPNEITQDGQKLEELHVDIGETITFRINNTSGLEHDFHIGTKLEMINNRVEGLPGVPVWTDGVQEFTWVVPEDVEELRYGCTVHGHYVNMRGSFIVGE